MTWPGKLYELFTRFSRPSAEETQRQLLALRVGLEWSRPTLAALLGVSRHTLRRWEEGQRQPCAAARRLIWLVYRLYVEGKPLGSLWEISTWGRV